MGAKIKAFGNFAWPYPVKGQSSVICDRNSAAEPPSRLCPRQHPGQTLDAQLEQLCKAGCSKIYRKKATGARGDRRKLLKMLDTVELDDVVTVTRIDRLARSTFDPVRDRVAFSHRWAVRYLSRGGSG
jgi:hypothetical protein